MRTFIYNTFNSWVLSLAGGVVGGPMLWKALQPLLDGDAATVVSWGAIVNGAAVLIGGFWARDNSKGVKGLKALVTAKK